MSEDDDEIQDSLAPPGVPRFGSFEPRRPTHIPLYVHQTSKAPPVVADGPCFDRDRLRNPVKWRRPRRRVSSDHGGRFGRGKRGESREETAGERRKVSEFSSALLSPFSTLLLYCRERGNGGGREDSKRVSLTPQ